MAGLLVFACTSSPAGADEHNYNQWASMEFKQWKFTPKPYYYSWYTVKVFGISIRLPGLGIHDNGPAGIGAVGDHYVDERWRQMAPLRLASVAEHKLETEQNGKESENWNDVYKDDLLTIADRTVDAAYSVTRERRDGLISDADGYATLIEGDYEKERIREEKERILSNVNAIRGANMENAKKVAAYEKESDNLERLVEAEKFIALLDITNKIIRGK